MAKSYLDREPSELQEMQLPTGTNQVQRMRADTSQILQACNELSEGSNRGVLDTKIARHTRMRVSDVRDRLRQLKEEGYISLYKVEEPEGLEALIEPEGRTELSTRSPLPDDSRLSMGEPRPINVVPKGLRSYDKDDAGFFLDLLPPPRHPNDGLPLIIHFWKARIEEPEPDTTFRVGVIYGPSGCGKSSLVKAGLLPRLSDPVLRVYVEATPDQTESDLLKGIRWKCPDLPPDLGLDRTLAALHDGGGLPLGRRLLLVIDQFEQWLVANLWREDTDLEKALGHCDEERVRAILMVRDDFLSATIQFMEEIGIEFRSRLNATRVELFTPHQAEKVLADFGRADRILRDRLTTEQQEFITQAVKALALQDGMIIPVQLALLFETFKSREWTTKTLQEVGNAEGVGVAFLEKTFNSDYADPILRSHQEAAQSVLGALLPESGSEIKRPRRPWQELLDASGYSSEPRKFHDLILILDNELRLITPIDREGKRDDSEPPGGAPERYYQLTHDYLVPSLREWGSNKGKVEYLYSRLLDAGPAELLVLRDELRPFRERLIERLWRDLEQSDGTNHALQAASSLALYDPSSHRWENVGGKVAEAMVTVNAVHLGFWLNALRPVRDRLMVPLTALYRDRKRSETERNLASNLLEDYATDQPQVLTDLLMDSEEKHFDLWFAKLADHQNIAVPLLSDGIARSLPEAVEVEKDGLAKRQARAAVAMIRLGRAEPVWPLLRHSPDPSLRSYLVNWLKPLGADPKALLARMESLKSAQGRRQWTGDRRWTPSSSIRRPQTPGVDPDPGWIRPRRVVLRPA